MANQLTQTTSATLGPHDRLFGTTSFELDIDRVINGRKFRTTTATLACVIACSGTSQLAEFCFERTGLFLSPRGQWFLAGEGGALRHWGRRSIDGGRCPGGFAAHLANRSQAAPGAARRPDRTFFESEAG